MFLEKKELICDQGRNWGAERRRGGGVSSEWQKFRPSSRYHAWRQIAVRTIPYPTLYNNSTIDLLCHFQNTSFSALHFPRCQDNDWILAIFASFNILVLNFSSKITSTPPKKQNNKILTNIKTNINESPLSTYFNQNWKQSHMQSGTCLWFLQYQQQFISNS